MIFLDKFWTLWKVYLLKFRIFLTLNELNMIFLKQKKFKLKVTKKFGCRNQILR